MKVYIGRSMYYSEDQVLGLYDEGDDLEVIMNKYFQEYNIKSYYSRWSPDRDAEGNPMWLIDFGSWIRFFYVCDLSGELLERWNKIILGGNYVKTE